MQKVVDRNIETKCSTRKVESDFGVGTYEIPHNNLIELDDNIIQTTQGLDVAPRSFKEAMQQISELKRRLDALASDAVVKPHTRNLSTWDFYLEHMGFYLKTNIAKGWQDCWKWIEIGKIFDLPPKFHKDTIVTLKGLSKAKVKDVFRVLGMRDFISLVGHDLEGLGIPSSMDGRGHQTRLNWLFNPANTGLRLVDLVNHGLVLFTLEFPSETFQSDFNP